MSGTTHPTVVLNWKEEPKKMPDMLNVLTILTFVGCGLFGLLAIYNFFNVEKSYQRMLEMQSKLDQMPAYMRKFMGPEMVEVTRKSMENKVPILVLTIVSFGLCIYGALQ